MSKLGELKDLVAKMFEGAKDKSSIENLALLNNTIGEVEKEQTELEDKNGELIKSYKDVIKHTSFKDDKPPEDPVNGGSLPSFEDALNKFIKDTKKE